MSLVLATNPACRIVVIMNGDMAAVDTVMMSALNVVSSVVMYSLHVLISISTFTPARFSEQFVRV